MCCAGLRRWTRRPLEIGNDGNEIEEWMQKSWGDGVQVVGYPFGEIDSTFLDPGWKEVKSKAKESE